MILNLFIFSQIVGLCLRGKKQPLFAKRNINNTHIITCTIRDPHRIKQLIIELLLNMNGQLFSLLSTKTAVIIIHCEMLVNDHEYYTKIVEFYEKKINLS